MSLNVVFQLDYLNLNFSYVIKCVNELTSYTEKTERTYNTYREAALTKYSLPDK